MPTALKISKFIITSKTFPPEVFLILNTSGKANFKWQRNMVYRLYLFKGSGSLTRGDSAKFGGKNLKVFDIIFMPFVNNWLLSISLRFETTNSWNLQ